jgi:hypothetical protein
MIASIPATIEIPETECCKPEWKFRLLRHALRQGLRLAQLRESRTFSAHPPFSYADLGLRPAFIFRAFGAVAHERSRW